MRSTTRNHAAGFKANESINLLEGKAGPARGEMIEPRRQPTAPVAHALCPGLAVVPAVHVG